MALYEVQLTKPATDYLNANVVVEAANAEEAATTALAIATYDAERLDKFFRFGECGETGDVTVYDVAPGDSGDEIDFRAADEREAIESYEAPAEEPPADPRPRIIVEVVGGLVVAVFSNDNLNVDVLDHDNWNCVARRNHSVPHDPQTGEAAPDKWEHIDECDDHTPEAFEEYKKLSAEVATLKEIY